MLSANFAVTSFLSTASPQSRHGVGIQCNTRNASSPHVARVFADHRLTLLALKGLLKLRHIGDHAIHAEFRRRMRIGLGLHTQPFRRQIRAPGLPKRNEEALLGTEPALFRIWLVAL